MMRAAYLALPALLVLGACGHQSVTERKGPDELLAGRQAPLVVPPDYNLTPPRPGTPRPLAPDSRTEALQALFPDQPAEPPKSAAETTLLELSGASRADATARATVADPTTTVVNKGAFVRQLIEAPAGGDRATAVLSAGD